MRMLQGLLAEVERIPTVLYCGHVTSLVGGLIEVVGPKDKSFIGGACHIESKNPAPIKAEVVGFRDNKTLLMPFSSMEGVGPGSKVDFLGYEYAAFPDTSWLGRVVNAFGEAIDREGPLKLGPWRYPLKAPPVAAHERAMVGERLDIGVRAMNTFLPSCQGQRMGIFAGSGVGKSVLMGQFARHAKADVIVIGLIGERGREVKEFIAHSLGEEGLKKSVLIVSTSDEPALMRRQAAYMTLAVAEYFRDQGQQVLCLMDSVTRFAMALREIGLAVGEPTASKGYTPTVFSELPKLLERAGPGREGQDPKYITGLFTVLVEGDDHNEPVADTVRGILDGHIVLDRSIAERGRFPAINLLKSVSRTLPGCHSGEENALIQRAKQLLATYENMAEMIRLGVYKVGSDPKVDEAIHHYDALEAFIAQPIETCKTIEESFDELRAILNT